MSSFFSDQFAARLPLLLYHMGRSITYAAPYEEPATLTAIVTDGANLPESLSGMALMVEARSTDFAALPVRSGTIAYGTREYYVQSVDVDNDGWVRLGCTRIGSVED